MFGLIGYLVVIPNRGLTEIIPNCKPKYSRFYIVLSGQLKQYYFVFVLDIGTKYVLNLFIEKVIFNYACTDFFY